MPAFPDLPLARRPLNHYGNLEGMIRAIRAHRPLDLSAERWRRAHPRGTFAQWQAQARACLREGLHCEPGPVDLRPLILERKEREGFILERVEFTTAPWSRVEGYFLLPTGVPYPVPGLVVFHAWGGPMLFGRERIVDTGRDHPVLAAHRRESYSGRYLAEEFARRGYAVIAIDAHHFGARAPRGLGAIPAQYDPFALSVEEYQALDTLVREQLYLGVRQLNWAGTTWAGINFWDDSRCVDYLQRRSEVDPERLGCTGLSGGGWRTNILAALDGRVRASASVGWMSTGDYQQVYNIAGAIGTFCLLPGVWDRLDVPDLTIMAAPGAHMVVNCSEDDLFPPEAQAEAARQIALGYEWAGCPEHFGHYNPPKPHCCDAQIQAEVLAWFDRHLKGGRA
jgi:dienelactone hydrolase